MLAVALTFTLLILTIAVVAARRRHFLLAADEENEANFRLPIKAVSLFAAPDAAALAAKIEREKRQLESAKERERILAWASLVDFAQLPEVKLIADEKLRRDALDILTERAKTNEDICALIKFVLANEEIKASKNLVRSFQKVWQSAPNRNATINLLRLAAESDDAETFLQTMIDAEQFIAAGALHDLSKIELYNLARSHYWLLGEQARISGAGFMLKQKLHGFKE